MSKTGKRQKLKVKRTEKRGDGFAAIAIRQNELSQMLGLSLLSEWVCRTAVLRRFGVGVLLQYLLNSNQW